METGAGATLYYSVNNGSTKIQVTKIKSPMNYKGPQIKETEIELLADNWDKSAPATAAPPSVDGEIVYDATQYASLMALLLVFDVNVAYNMQWYLHFDGTPYSDIISGDAYLKELGEIAFDRQKEKVFKFSVQWSGMPTFTPGS